MKRGQQELEWLVYVFILLLMGADALILFGIFGRSAHTAWPRLVFGVFLQLGAVVVASGLATQPSVTSERVPLRIIVMMFVALAMFTWGGISLFHNGVAYGDQPLKSRGHD